MKHETMQELSRAAPPVGMAGLTLWGVSLNEWLILLTIVYTIFLIVDKLPTVVTRAREFSRWVKEKLNGESN